MKLTIETHGDKSVIHDISNREIAILRTKEDVVRAVSSWIYTGKMKVLFDEQNNTHSTSDRGTLQREAQ